MTEPTFDADGYPTEETENAIRDWPSQDCLGLLEFCRRAWYYPEAWIIRKDGSHRVATGGWSGNEQIISALESNHMFMALCWQMSARGGLHVYKPPQYQIDKANEELSK